MLDLLLHRLLASRSTDDPRLEGLLVELADLSMRDRVPYFGFLLDLSADPNLAPGVRRAALLAMNGAHGWAVAERAIEALTDPAVRGAGLTVIARVADTAPMRWVHVAFHPDAAVRREAYASPWPSKTRVFDTFLLADPVVRDAIVAEHERSPIPFDTEDLPTLLDAVERGYLAATSARSAFFQQKGKFLAAVSLLSAESEVAAKSAFDAALADPIGLAAGARHRSRLVAFLRAFPVIDDAWLFLLKDQAPRGLRHRLAIAAWTTLDQTAGAERDGLVELIILSDVRFVSTLPTAEARRHLRSLCKKRMSAVDHPDAVKALVQSSLVAPVDATGPHRLDFEVLAALLSFVGSNVFDRAVEWVGRDALLRALTLDPDSAAAFAGLPPRGATKVGTLLDALEEPARTRALVATFEQVDPSRFGELGVGRPAAQAAFLVAAESPSARSMDPARATAIAALVQSLAGPGALRKIVPACLASRTEPTPLDRALVRESAIATDADAWVDHVSAMASTDLVRLVSWIDGIEHFPMGKELALAHRLASSSSETLRSWATARLPAEEVPTRARKELPRAAVGVAFRAHAAPAATIDEEVARAVALLGSADPIAATDAALERFPFGDAAFDEALDRALVAAFSGRTGGLSPLGHAWLWRWDAHALVHLELCLAAHATIADAIRARLGLRTRVFRRISLEAIASALDVLRFRDKARFRALVEPALVEALVEALPSEAEVVVSTVLRRIFESSEVSLVDVLPSLRAALPELGDEARKELTPIIDSRGLPPRRVRRARDADVDDETLAMIRASTDLHALTALTADPRAVVVEEATLRLLLLGEAGQMALASRIEETASAEAVAPIVSSVPLWAEGASLERARRVMVDHPHTERAFRIALALLERREADARRADATTSAIDAARDPLEPGWFRAEDWDALARAVPPRSLARSLATSPQAHASLRAIELLLGGELDAADAEALRAYLDCGTERMGSQRRRAALKLLSSGDTHGLPIAVASALDETSGRSTLFADVDAAGAAIIVRGLLAAGATIVKESSIVHHVVGMPLTTCDEAFREILDRATTDAARMTAARYAGSRVSRERKLMRVVDTFAWGVRVARRMLGKPMRVRMTGSQSLGFTRTRENVVYVTPLPILRGDRHGVEVVEALIIHEIGHHLYHAGPSNDQVWQRAQKAGIGGLLNLVADEHLERNIRALDRDHGDRLKRLAAYAFQHTKRMLPVRRVLSHAGAAAAEILPSVGLGVARADDSVLIETGSFLFAMEKSALAFSRFARALRMGLGNRHDDPKVAEALALFGPSFRSSTMEELLAIAEKLRDIFGWETNLCESFGAHEAIEDAHADVDSVVWGEGLSQEEVDSMVRRITERSEAPSSPSGGGGLALNVGADEKFDLIQRVERKTFDAMAHAPYARRVQRPAQLLRRYFEELGLGHRPEKMRLSGRRLDSSRLLPLVLHGDPRMLLARQTFFARDLFLGIVVDCSGSMASRDNMERGKLFAALLAEAAAPLSGIDTRILGFTDQVIYDCGDAKRPAAHALVARGGNNDAAALYHLAKIAKQSQRKAKVLVMVSDGLPTECTVAALRGLVRHLGRRERMVCAQVAVQALAEVCFPHYVVLSDASIEVTVNKFGALVAKLVARAIENG